MSADRQDCRHHRRRPALLIHSRATAPCLTLTTTLCRLRRPPPPSILVGQCTTVKRIGRTSSRRPPTNRTVRYRTCFRPTTYRCCTVAQRRHQCPRPSWSIVTTAAWQDIREPSARSPTSRRLHRRRATNWTTRHRHQRPNNSSSNNKER